MEIRCALQSQMFVQAKRIRQPAGLAEKQLRIVPMGPQIIGVGAGNAQIKCRLKFTLAGGKNMMLIGFAPLLQPFCK